MSVSVTVRAALSYSAPICQSSQYNPVIASLPSASGDGALLAQARDLFLRQVEQLAQNLGGVLAERRRGLGNRALDPGHLDRIAGHAHPADLRMLVFHDHLP